MKLIPLLGQFFILFFKDKIHFNRLQENFYVKELVKNASPKISVKVWLKSRARVPLLMASVREVM
jgi:hypothetical protein